VGEGYPGPHVMDSGNFVGNCRLGLMSATAQIFAHSSAFLLFRSLDPPPSSTTMFSVVRPGALRSCASRAGHYAVSCISVHCYISTTDPCQQGLPRSMIARNMNSKVNGMWFVQLELANTSNKHEQGQSLVLTWVPPTLVFPLWRVRHLV
jgi:hypothetical protein